MVKDFAGNEGSAFRSLAAVGATLATAGAVIVGAVLAVFAAATVAVIAVPGPPTSAFQLGGRHCGSARKNWNKSLTTRRALLAMRFTL